MNRLSFKEVVTGLYQGIWENWIVLLVFLFFSTLDY